MNKIPIFMYHHVKEYNQSTPLKSLFVSPSSFKKQMQIMRMLGFKGLSMSALLPYLEGKKSGKVFGITFDDGYEDVFLNALPILKELGFSSTNYIVSSQINGTNVWDKKHNDEHSLMSMSSLEKWLESGQYLGVHTANHVHLNDMTDEQYNDEILNSRNYLEQAFEGACFDHFCYPYGEYNPEVVKFLRQSGFKTATTTRRSVVKKGDDLLELPRIFMKDDMGFFKIFHRAILG